jgi:hypothetical protein
MLKESSSSAFAAQIESAEIDAWVDMYAAIPHDFGQRFMPEMLHVGNVALTRCKAIPFVHFNCVMNFGMTELATEQALDEILTLYHTVDMRQFAFFHTPHFQPTEITEWFQKRNLQLKGGWERIGRDGNTPETTVIAIQNGFRVEKVTQQTASEWAAYIDSVYGLPTSPWLVAFAVRPGWHHYLLRQDARIVAVRSMYVNANGIAWLGIEAPVPGVMGPTFDLDCQICQAIIRDATNLGVKYIAADIELPSPTMDTPAYRNFEALGFRHLYFRSHYGY